MALDGLAGGVFGAIEALSAESPFEFGSAGRSASGVVPGTIDLTLAIMGVGALVAVIGGIMYVTVVLVSILTGPRMEAGQLLLVAGPQNPLLESTKLTDHDLEDKQNQPRGALVLVFAFLVWFAMYYLGNWWLLGRTWFIR